MKYLKIYENFEERTLDDWLDKSFGKDYTFSKSTDHIDCRESNITNLNGIERIISNTKIFNCGKNPIGSLNGIEKLIFLDRLFCFGNGLKNLKGIENLNLTCLSCVNNELENLKEI